MCLSMKRNTHLPTLNVLSLRTWIKEDLDHGQKVSKHRCSAANIELNHFCAPCKHQDVRSDINQTDYICIPSAFILSEMITPAFSFIFSGMALHLIKSIIIGCHPIIVQPGIPGKFL